MRWGRDKITVLLLRALWRRRRWVPELDMIARVVVINVHRMLFLRTAGTDPHGRRSGRQLLLAG